MSNGSVPILVQVTGGGIAVEGGADRRSEVRVFAMLICSGSRARREQRA